MTPLTPRVVLGRRAGERRAAIAGLCFVARAEEA